MCPTTGRRVRKDISWEKISCSENLVADFSLIAGSIIYSRPYGTADLAGVKSSLALNDRIAECVDTSDGAHIQIEDYSRLQGSTAGARRYLTKRMNENTRLKALIFCNVSPVFALAIKIGERLNTAGHRIFIEADYSHAVERALQIAVETETEAQPPVLSGVFENLLKQSSLLPLCVRSSEKWNIRTEHCNSESYIINGKILYTWLTGTLDLEAVEFLKEMRKDVWAAQTSEWKIEYLIVQPVLLKGAAIQARNRYIRELRRWFQEHPVKMYALAAPEAWINVIVRLVMHTMPFKTILVKRLEEAFDLVFQDANGQTDIIQTAADCHGGKLCNKTVKVQDTMDLIGRINWEQRGLDSIPSVPEDDPLYYPSKALGVIKEEIDELLEARLIHEKELRQAYEQEKLLKHELHHRIKNTFLMIDGIISLTKDSVEDENTRAVLDALQNKITSLSSLYDVIDEQVQAGRADVKRYFSKIIETIQGTTSNISFEKTLQSAEVSTKTLVPLGIILAELITNSLKHGFSETAKKGNISVSVTVDSKALTVSYSDNGIGIQNTENPEDSDSLGFLLIRSLTEQLNSSFRIVDAGGFSCVIEVPL